MFKLLWNAFQSGETVEKLQGPTFIEIVNSTNHSNSNKKYWFK